MANTFTISGMGFAKLNTTTMPIMSIEYSPNMGVEPFRSGGDINASMVRRAGARPVFRFTAPLDAVWTTLNSFLPVSLTAFEMHAATFSATGIRASTGANIYKMPLTGAKCFAVISSISAAQGSVNLCLAEVLVYPTSDDGLTDPITTATGALPTLGSTPNLHVLGPIVDDTTARWGVRQWRIDLGVGMEPIQADGFFYPSAYRVGAIQATASINHSDISAIYTALTSDGKDAAGAGVILYARAYNMTTKVLTTTGYSFTFANCFASLDSMRLSGTDIADTTLRLTSYAAPGTLTHPVTVATAATLPT